MGNAIKKAANATVGFFRKVGEKIVNGTKKVLEVIVNGAKKVATFFKKVISYCRDGIKIVGKLFYYAGKQIVHTLTGKSGIPYLIEFFEELTKKNVSIKDENDNEVNPEDYLNNLKDQMQEGDTLKLKHEIIKKEIKSETESFREFEQEDDDPKDILGLKFNESIAKVGAREINLDNINNADVSLED